MLRIDEQGHMRTRFGFRVFDNQRRNRNWIYARGSEEACFSHPYGVSFGRQYGKIEVSDHRVDTRYDSWTWTTGGADLEGSYIDRFSIFIFGYLIFPEGGTLEPLDVPGTFRYECTEDQLVLNRISFEGFEGRPPDCLEMFPDEDFAVDDVDPDARSECERLGSSLPNPRGLNNRGDLARLAEYAKLAEAVYHYRDTGMWAVVSRHPGLGGFKAALYENGCGDYVLAFAGTEADPGDLAADLTGGFGLPDAQVVQASRLAAEMYARYGNDLVITGHSLGGALATVGAIATEAPAVTYNPAGISTIVERHYSSPSSPKEMLHIVHQDDPVSDLWNPIVERGFRSGKTLGSKYELDYPVEGVLDAHGIAGMRDYLVSQAEAGPPTFPDALPRPCP